MISIRPIRSAEIFGAPNAAALLKEYAAECSLPELAPVAPQAAMYAEMERSGAFRCFGVYAGDELAGFASALIYVVPHYGRKVATVESLFLAPAHRCGTAGHGLMNAIENHARERGCAAVLYSAPAASQFERLLRLLKPYRHSNTIFVRSL